MNRVKTVRSGFVSTTFATGSCTVILGENGAGKSTLLRIVAGLISPTRGSVTVYSRSPHQQRHRIAYMSHSAMLYDELTAMENLTYFAGLHRDSSCACVGSPEMALRAVGLDPNLNRPLGQYSQGMRQRTSLARVLQTDPELLLLDEPSLGLAPQMVDEVFEAIEEIHGEGTTILLVEQNALRALAIADRAYVVETGRILLSGTGAALRRNPEVQKAYLGG